MINKLLSQGGAAVQQCHALNISVCPITATSSRGFRVTVYNSIARNRVETIM